ncbi:MAG: hypothetical protein JO270_25685 [Acidobacteriaceae bacterium]|nr:hypothetical protein [Acidobacteriaceae bacterium]
MISKRVSIAASFITVGLLTSASPRVINAQSNNFTSFTDIAGKHIVYVSSDSHVHQLQCIANCSLATNWINQDLTALSGGPATASSLSSRVFSFSDQAGEHVFWTDALSGHVNHLFFNGSWINTDLGVQTETSQNAITGYSNVGGERLFYVTADSHVHVLTSTASAQLASNGASWVDTDITAQTGGALAGNTDFSQSSFSDSLGEHLFYSGVDGHVHQLYGHWESICVNIFGQRICFGPFFIWNNQDLTATTGGPVVGAALTSFSDSLGEHVFYVGQGDHVHQLFLNGGGWVDQDLSLQAGTYNSGIVLASFSDSFGEHVQYVGTWDAHLHQLWHNGTTVGPWVDQDLTTLGNGLPIPSSCLESLTSFSDLSGEYVFYFPGDDIHLLNSSPGSGWSDQPLLASQPDNLPYCWID